MADQSRNPQDRADLAALRSELERDIGELKAEARLAADAAAKAESTTRKASQEEATARRARTGGRRLPADEPLPQVAQAGQVANQLERGARAAERQAKALKAGQEQLALRAGEQGALFATGGGRPIRSGGQLPLFADTHRPGQLPLFAEEERLTAARERGLQAAARMRAAVDAAASGRTPLLLGPGGGALVRRNLPAPQDVPYARYIPGTGGPVGGGGGGGGGRPPPPPPPPAGPPPGGRPTGGRVGADEVRSQAQGYRDAVAAGAKYDDSLRRHGALTSEFFAALARGEITFAEFRYQLGATIAKFAGWTAASVLVFGALDAIRQLGKGALDSASGVNRLQRYINDVNTDKAQAQFVELSRQFNLPIGDVADAMAQMGQVFHNQNDAFTATKAALYGVKTGQLSVADSTRFLLGIVRGFQLPANQLGSVFDRINQAQNKFGVGIRDTTAGVAKAAGTWHAAGGDINTLTSLITAGAAKTGRTGQEMGTAFQRSAEIINRGSKLTKQRLAEFGLDPKEGVQGLYQHALSLVESGHVKGPDVTRLAVALSTPQLGTRISPILQDPAYYRKVSNTLADSSGSGKRELNTLKQSAAEQISALGNNLQRLGSEFAQAGGALPLAGLVKALNLGLNLTTQLLGLFNQLPKPLREAAVLGLELAGTMKLLGRFGIGLPRGAEAVEARRTAQVRIEDLTGRARGAQGELTNVAADRAVATRLEATGEVDAAARLRADADRREAIAAAQLAVAEEELKIAIQERAALNTRAGIADAAGGPARAGRVERGLGDAANFVRGGEGETPGVLRGAVAGGLDRTAGAAARAGGAVTNLTTRLGSWGSAMASSLSGLDAMIIGVIGLGFAVEEYNKQKQRTQAVQNRAAAGGESPAELRGIAAQIDKVGHGNFLQRAEGSGFVRNVLGNAPLIGPAANVVGNYQHNRLQGAKDFADRERALAQQLQDLQKGGDELPVATIRANFARNFKRAGSDKEKLQALRTERTQLDNALATLSPQEAHQLGIRAPGRDAKEAWRRENENLAGLMQEFVNGKTSLGETLSVLDPDTAASRVTGLQNRIARQGFTRGNQRSVGRLQAQIRASLRNATTPEDAQKLIQQADTLQQAAEQEINKRLSRLTATGVPVHVQKAARTTAISQLRRATVDPIVRAVEQLKADRDGILAAIAALRVQIATDPITRAFSGFGGGANDQIDKLKRGAHQDTAALKELRPFLRQQKQNARGFAQEQKQGQQAAAANAADLFDAETSLKESQTADPLAQARIAAQRLHQRISILRNAGASTQVVDQAIAEYNQALQQLAQASLSRFQSIVAVGSARANIGATQGAQLSRAVSDAQRIVAYVRAQGSKLDPQALRDAQLSLYQAEGALVDYQQQQAQALVEAEGALAESRTNDPVKRAEIAANTARRLVRFARTAADRKNAQAELNNRRREANQARQQAAYDDIQFQADIGKITTQVEIQRLQQLLKTIKGNQELRRQIRRQIYQLKHESDQNLQDLDVGNIRLPSLYEIRRAVKAQRGGVNVTQSYTVNVNVNRPSDANLVFDKVDQLNRGAGRSAARAAGLA